MKAMVVRTPNKPLVFEERPVPAPGPGQVRIKVHACGICHSDAFVTGQLWPGLELPRVPGHEIAGVIDAVGEGVQIGRQVRAATRDQENGRAEGVASGASGVASVAGMARETNVPRPTVEVSHPSPTSRS